MPLTKTRLKGMKRLRSSMNCVRCLWICLSRGFVKIERKDVGLKLLGSERLLVLGNDLPSERERGYNSLFTRVLDKHVCIFTSTPRPNKGQLYI